MSVRRRTAAVASAALLLASCGGGGGNNAPAPTPTPSPAAAPPPAALYAPPAQVALSSAEVGQIVAQAVAQAQAINASATVAVTDRVGNVLAVFRMDGAAPSAKISGAPDGHDIDLQGLTVPSPAAAIAKAITGAYLSSGGNAFSTRTASMIVQQQFPPAPTTAGLESGPLFGVQFSQLACSDLSTRFGSGMLGPKRSPLGLAADPGGFPLYKNGVLVGGVGAITDGAYGYDPNVLDVDTSSDEAVALAGTVGFEAPEAIRADRIYVDGTQLRYSDTSYSSLASVGSASFAAAVVHGDLQAVTGYYWGGLLAGAAYGSEDSGVRPSTPAEFANANAFVLTDGGGRNRYPIRNGSDAAEVAQPITAAEARAILEEAFGVMSRARAQIRSPLDSRAQVSISLVDTRGAVLGIVRAPDAPIFGIDVSLQKARTASFLSNRAAAGDLAAATGEVPLFLQRLRTFLGDPNALTGAYAFTDRAGGNLSRPHFPDGEVAQPNGPLSRPVEQFNPFSTGLQSALVTKSLLQHLAYVTGAAPSDVPQQCGDVARLANGTQIFPGSVPVYRGGQLVGGLGVSGDGIDQDDMISFLGLASAAARVGSGINNAPVTMRADQIVVDVGGRQVRLRYVNCPFAPFVDSAEQNVCQGL